MNELNYWIGNPSVEITSGDIYLQETKQQEQCWKQPLKDFKGILSRLKQETTINGRCLLLLGVPNSKPPVEICEVIEEGLQMLEESRILKTS